jgi:hypothetical protein
MERTFSKRRCRRAMVNLGPFSSWTGIATFVRLSSTSGFVRNRTYARDFLESLDGTPFWHPAVLSMRLQSVTIARRFSTVAPSYRTIVEALRFDIPLF